ncbi:hypothetical protein [Mesoplasma coleopterae]|uniref:Transcriptional regulator n=1 Tax=Mesoplasma coleopterae TaxID=324078 RepID=A0A2K8P328_9MOLU|nr:hypothetical protein [Mesoplasma coleopterae]ATZ21152.1 transcriptional regulator [Mesoplasma coleopterae]
MNIYEKLKIQQKNFTNTTNQIIANEILCHAMKGIYLKQKELANKAYVSESTITKFSKNLEFSGYKELIYNLKNQEKISKINNVGGTETLFKEIDEWIRSKKNFINDLALSIIKEKNVYIYSSYQLRIASNFIYELLLEGDITPIILETQYIYMKKIKKKENAVNIFLFAGLDTDSLVDQIDFELKGDFDFENIYLITSRFSEEKLKKYNFKTIKLDFNYNSSSFLIRNIAIQMLFIEVLNVMKKTF